MAPLRIRHPKGVSTIDIDLESGTVLELQQEIRKVTGILPSLQDVKTGFPPRSITLISELPIASLGLQRGDQLIIGELKATPTSTAPAPQPQPIERTIASQGTVRKGENAPPRPQPAPKTIPTPAQPVPTASSSSTSRAAPPVITPTPTVLGQGAQGDEVETDSGVVVHRIVPDDNSCLFSSVGIVLEQDMGKGASLRRVVADAIMKNPIKYDEATLGRSTDDYIRTILKPSTWGGAIELSIFSDYYKTEITSIDVETGRCDRFGEGQYASRVILLYSGIHYDAVSLAPIPDAPLDFHTTIFPVEDEAILQGALKLATVLRGKKQFTNTATFDLRCEICNVGLKGEKGAREHATQTGHTAFGEY
ncbi:related to OTU1-Yeast OTU Deubiquitinating enzyme 1 [Serendipita indica DSM 11827]|uniref:Ubiquitin thioesterase OTU n=1 Tax=Serendipita indica (strain DSM 11827) TaxID=1109443 RepID=G4TEP3_SERID|nr:related to OTU1-Yeast OTU Deubiquitinating enzyme 1 [Serendipita indica DSM 11827]